jgi:hypothetical protein
MHVEPVPEWGARNAVVGRCRSDLFLRRTRRNRRTRVVGDEPLPAVRYEAGHISLLVVGQADFACAGLERCALWLCVYVVLERGSIPDDTDRFVGEGVSDVAGRVRFDVVSDC